MKKFVIMEKLSKKAKKLLHAQKRVLWDTPPVSKVIPNKKKNHLQNHLQRQRPDHDDDNG